MSKNLTQIERVFKVGSTSPAQSNTLLQPDNELREYIQRFRRAIDTASSRGWQFQLLLHILLHSGCRVSEVLRIRSSDIDMFYNVYIRSSKGSNNRIVKVPEPSFVSFRTIVQAGDLFSCYSRFYVYRYLKASGLYLTFKNSTNKFVTHAPRLAYIKSIETLSHDLEASRVAVGHKNVKNTIRYVNKK